MPVAAIVTIAVCLSLFGSTLLMRQGVDNVAVRWREGIEVIAFLKSDVSDEQHDAITAFHGKTGGFGFGLGFEVHTKLGGDSALMGSVGEYGWSGAAGTSFGA